MWASGKGREPQRLLGFRLELVEGGWRHFHGEGVDGEREGVEKLWYQGHGIQGQSRCLPSLSS